MIQNKKRILTFLTVTSLTVLMIPVPATAAENTTVMSEYPYPSTFSNHIQVPKQGDSALEARNATTKSKGVPWKVGKYTKHQLNTMNASYVLDLLTGNSKVYDNKGNVLGTAKEVFNGVWDELDPAKALQENNGSGGGSRYKMPTNDISKFDPNAKKKTTEKLYIPDNAVYVDLSNIKPGAKGYTSVKSLTIPMWNQAAEFSAFYDKDYKAVKFTRVSGDYF